MKTYSEFINVVNNQVAMYSQIPERYLSIEGQKVYELYKAVEFLACFTSNATELLALLKDDEDVAKAAEFAGAELRKIRRCLEGLATEEAASAA